MAKIARKAAKIFGGGLSAGSHEMEQFGSKVQVGTPLYTVDPDVIQALAAWLNGWIAAIDSGTKAPYVQDMNAVCFVLAYQIAYMFQAGIPEWDSDTTYFENSVVQANSGQWYVSITDNNVGNAPSSGVTDANWQWVNPPELVASGAIAANSIPKVNGSATTGPDGSLSMVQGLLSDDGTNVIIGGTPTVNGLQFPDGTVQKTAAVNNAPSVQNVVTGSRALNTVFQNTGTKPMYVAVSVQGSSPTVSVAYTDATPTPTAQVGQAGDGAGNVPPVFILGSMFFIVLPGNYYRVVSNQALTAWVEYT